MLVEIEELSEAMLTSIGRLAVLVLEVLVEVFLGVPAFIAFISPLTSPISLLSSPTEEERVVRRDIILLKSSLETEELLLLVEEGRGRVPSSSDSLLSRTIIKLSCDGGMMHVNRRKMPNKRMSLLRNECTGDGLG